MSNLNSDFKKPTKIQWKKIIVLFVLPILYIVVDGTLNYDILDFKMDTSFKWFAFLIFLALFFAIYMADYKKHKSSKLDD